MLFNLVSTFTTGIAAAGTVMLIFRLLGRRSPRWLLPGVAGAAMFGFHLWNEYSWFDRTATALPDHMVVAERYDYRSVLQPWTLLVPRTDRFSALDRASLRRHDAAPDYVMADVVLVMRLQPTAKVTQIYDCDGIRRTDVSASLAVDERGLPLEAAWIASDADDALFRLVCDSSRPDARRPGNDQEGADRRG